MYITSFKSLAIVTLSGFLHDKYTEVEIPPEHTSIEINSDHRIKNWIKEIRVSKGLCFIGYDRAFLYGKPYFFPSGYYHLARHPLYPKISSFDSIKSETCDESVLNFIYPKRNFKGTPIPFPTYFNFNNYEAALPAEGSCLVIYKDIMMTGNRVAYIEPEPQTKQIFWLDIDIYPLISVRDDECNTYL